MTASPRSLQATSVFLSIVGLKAMAGPEGLGALTALHGVLRNTLETLARVPGIRVLSRLMGAIVIVPDTANMEVVEELFMGLAAAIAGAGVAVRAGITHGLIEWLDDADGTRNAIGVCLNQAARVANAENNAGLLVERSYANHVVPRLSETHWLHPRRRVSVEVAGKRDEKFECFAPPSGVLRALDKSTIAPAGGQPAFNAILLAYDLPKFSDGDARNLASRFRSIVQEIQHLVDDGTIPHDGIQFSPGGDGGVLAIEGVSTTRAHRIATERRRC